MKNSKFFLPICLIVLCVTIAAVIVGSTCRFNNCNNRKVKNGEYCSDHTCEWEGCTSEKCTGNKHYCFYHMQQIDSQRQSEETILTESQISSAKKVIEEYIQYLVKESSIISEVNLLSDKPDAVIDSVLIYRCNVDREKLGTLSATIYLSILEDGTFKVTKLLYD